MSTDSAGNWNEEREADAGGMENHHSPDREIFLALLRRNDIPFEADEEGLEVRMTVDRYGDSDKVGGYHEFFTIFTFEPGGKLDHVEVWE